MKMLANANVVGECGRVKSEKGPRTTRSVQGCVVDYHPEEVDADENDSWVEGRRPARAAGYLLGT